MLGVGVGFDDKGADKDFTIYSPTPVEPTSATYIVPDTREGWYISTAMLIDSYLKSSQNEVYFDYSLIRPAGTPIKTFGGIAAGHEP